MPAAPGTLSLKILVGVAGRSAAIGTGLWLASTPDWSHQLLHLAIAYATLVLWCGIDNFGVLRRWPTVLILAALLCLGGIQFGSFLLFTVGPVGWHP